MDSRKNCANLLRYLLPKQAFTNKSPSISISDGEQEYGRLYGAPYSESDDSQWLIIYKYKTYIT